MNEEINANFTLNNESLDVDFELTENNFDAVFEINAAGAVWGTIEGDISNQIDLTNALNSKQNVISDLEAIRTNATNGASAYTTIQTYGDIVTYNASDFATSAQGTLADSALQPNDNISELVNDSGYITSSALSGYATETWVGNQGYITGITSSDVTDALGYTPANSSSLATVATSGSYTDLSNKPTIPTVNNATLTIQKNGTNVQTFTANASTDVTANITVPTTASDVGALPSTTTINDLTTTAQQNALNSGATTTNIGQISTNTSDISTINGKIPSAATSSNQLADKSFVNSSISTNTAYFIGTFNSVAELEAYSGSLTNNDYAFVATTDAAGNTLYDRYKYNADTQQWIFEYELNNSSFTAAQWASINSGITSGDVSLIQSALQPNDNVSELVNDAGYITSASLPTVNNGTLDIQVNGSSIGTFTANQAGNTTANIVVPDSATWGNITGTLSNQTDLQNALNAKYDATNPNGYQANVIETVKVNGTALTPTNKAVNVETLYFYGTCTTKNSTQIKVVECPEFTELKEGASIKVRFTNGQSYNGAPKLNVNSTGAISVVLKGTTGGVRYMWQAGDVVDFVYDGTYWAWDKGGVATTTYYGVTKLGTSATSTATGTALTPLSLNSLVQNMIEPYPVYSTSATYEVGDRVRYEYQAWECNTAITGEGEAWDETHWTALDPIQTQLDNKVSNTDYANSATGGVLKVSSTTGTGISGAGVLYASNSSYATYQDASDYFFISKGTLENVLTSRGYTDNIGTVTSVNNVSPVSGNVTLSIPTDTADLTNGAGFITGISSSDVTTALGYTPYDSSNPDGYITSASLPTVNNSTITIQKNGTTVESFTLNQSSNETINITVPTQASDIGAQATLVSGTNIKTINGQSVLGSGNIDTPYRNIGEIVASTIPLTDAGLHLLDGALISGSGSYADFVTHIAGLVSDYPDLFETEANWQTAVTTYGVCGKFVYDSVNNTVRLPKITGFVEGTIDPTTLGDLVEAGLPNITGSFKSLPARNGNAGADGCFTAEQNSSYSAYTQTDSLLVKLDASLSNSIYGNSATVQPQAVKVLYYIVIATTEKTEIEVDIDEIATDLNGKADTDLSNINPSQSAKNSIIDWGMPDYSATIDITSTVTTSSTQNRSYNYPIMLTFWASSPNVSGGNVYFECDGYSVYSNGYSYNADVVTVFVEASKNFKIYNNGIAPNGQNISVVPLKGGNYA